MSSSKTELRKVFAETPVVILAGGRGTRLIEETHAIPKPMVPIGGRPILFHIMSYYARFGCKEFIVCLGYKGHIIKDYFLNLRQYTCSLVVRNGTGESEYLESETSDWNISLIETGDNSLTATRIKRVSEYIHTQNFFLTYGDGVTDIDLFAEWDYHIQQGRLGTVAAVHPPSRFGNLVIDDNGFVESFKEKEPLKHDFINGGYFIFRREFLNRIPADANLSLESKPLNQLADDGELAAYRHTGFWQCMDTIRDMKYLEDIIQSNQAPWLQ